MIYVIDSNDEDFKKIWCFDYKEKFLNEYKIMTTEEHMILCKEYNISRIILLRTLCFNYDTIEEIKKNLNNYIKYYIFRSCVEGSVPIMFSDKEFGEINNIFLDDNIFRKDTEKSKLQRINFSSQLIISKSFLII